VIGKEFGKAIRDFKTAALSGYIAPDVVQIGFGFRCYTVRYQLLTPVRRQAARGPGASRRQQAHAWIPEL
jgi:hypothetical protein